MAQSFDTMHGEHQFSPQCQPVEDLAQQPLGLLVQQSGVSAGNLRPADSLENDLLVFGMACRDGKEIHGFVMSYTQKEGFEIMDAGQ